MSLDDEGAELEVLQAIDLERYKIALMSIEHNHHIEKKNKMRDHLAGFGYTAIEHRNDDLFYNPEILAGISGGNFKQPEIAQDNVIKNYKLIEY